MLGDQIAQINMNLISIYDVGGLKYKKHIWNFKEPMDYTKAINCNVKFAKQF